MILYILSLRVYFIISNSTVPVLKVHTSTNVAAISTTCATRSFYNPSYYEVKFYSLSAADLSALLVNFVPSFLVSKVIYFACNFYRT